MSFSYDPAQADDVSKIRYRIGDTEENNGAFPDAKNVSDEELTASIAFEGSWERAVAASFEVLAAHWAAEMNVSVSDGGGSQSWQYQNTIKAFQEQAKWWRDRYGHIGDDQNPDSGETATSIQIGVMGGGYQRTW